MVSAVYILYNLVPAIQDDLSGANLNKNIYKRSCHDQA